MLALFVPDRPDYMDSRRGLKDKVALLTGAAGDIGSATATRLCSDGCIVVLTDLASKSDDLRRLRERLLESNPPARILTIPADVTEEDDVKKLISQTVTKFGKIDFLFNNAGIQGPFAPTDKYPSDAFAQIMKINVHGVFLCLKYASEAMIASGNGGVIVNTASLAGLVGPTNMVAYASSKHAVVGMTKSAAKDLARHGIRVCAIAPGILEGKMWDSQVKGQARCRAPAESEDEMIRSQATSMLNGTPMKRLGRLDEVSSVVSFLFSDDASYMTGTITNIDGGRFT